MNDGAGVGHGYGAGEAESARNALEAALARA